MIYIIYNESIKQLKLKNNNAEQQNPILPEANRDLLLDVELA